METENYYKENLETDKLNIYTTKQFYKSLSNEQRMVFKKYCLWSNKGECWVSKAKAGNSYHLQTNLKEMGFSDGGKTGEKLSFTEQVQREQQRAENRVESSLHRAEKAENNFEELYKKAKEMASVIPFGQPIMVGHHSEQRDRNYRDRINNTFGKAFNESDKADYYQQKAEIAKYTAEGGKFKNPKYLINRIKECEKHIRICERRLKGKFYTHSTQGEISDQERNFYNGRIKEEQDKLDYYTSCMKAINPDYGARKKETIPKKSKGKSI